MKVMKKLISCLLVLAMLGGICACKKSDSKKSRKTKKTEKVSVKGDDDDEIEESIDEVVAQPAIEPEEDINISTDMGVKVTFGSDLDIPTDTEMEVTRLEETVDDSIGAHYTEYEITLGDLHQLDGYIELRLPYNEANIPAGQDPAQCVAAMYFDEDENEWVPVIYEVDTEAKEVVIYTDHFSKYRCLEFENEGKRMAKVTNISDCLNKISFEDAKKAIEEYVQFEGPEEACRAVVVPYIEDSFRDFASKYGDANTTFGNFMTNLVTLNNGEKAFEYMPKSKDAIKTMGKAGLYISVVTFMFSVTKDNKTSDDIINLYKETAYLLVTVSGNPYLGSIAAGAWLVDVSVNEWANTIRSSVKEDEMKAYRYYMNTDKYGHKHLDRKAWRKVIYDTATQNPTSSNFDATNEIMKKIDDYCNEFWNLPYDDRYQVYADVGLSGKLQADKKMQEAISAEYKAELMDELAGVFNAVDKQLKNEAMKAALKELNKLKKYFNEAYTYTIKEVVEQDQAPRYAGCTAVFSQLNSAAVPEEWQIQLDDKGCGSFTMTWIGYVLAGEPMNLQLFAAGADLATAKPILTVPFSMDKPEIELKYEGIPLEELLGTYSGTFKLVSINLTDEGYEYYKTNPGDLADYDVDMDSMSKQDCDDSLKALIDESAYADIKLDKMTIESADPASGNCLFILDLSRENGSTGVLALKAVYDGTQFTVTGTDVSRMPNATGSDLPMTGIIEVQQDGATYHLTTNNLTCEEITEEGVHVYDEIFSIDATKD